MRETQIFGLTEEAYSFLENNAVHSPIVECPTCHNRTGGQINSRVYDSETGVQKGMFEDGPNLHEYLLKDGRHLREVVQADPWSSGPCIFLCLEDVATAERLFEWPEEEINNC